MIKKKQFKCDLIRDEKHVKRKITIIEIVMMMMETHIFLSLKKV